jgi:transposase-like protein
MYSRGQRPDAGESVRGDERLAALAVPPKRIVTDKPGSYAAAGHKVMPKIEHRQRKGLNNRAENSHSHPGI